MSFRERVTRARTDIKNTSFEKPPEELTSLLIRYNFEVAKIAGGELFSSVSPRKINEMSWLIEAAKCMNFNIDPQHRRDEITPENWETKVKTYNRAIVLLCWIDIMLDDLAENVRTPEECSVAFILFEEIQEYIEAKIGGKPPKEIKCDEAIKTYSETIILYIESLFRELDKLPEAHLPAKRMMLKGFTSLIHSLEFSATYRIQMESEPEKTMDTYTDNTDHDAKKTYIKANSGNMAMQIMVGMLSILLTEDAAQALEPSSDKFSQVGRIGNDCATGIDEIIQKQMNGIMYWARGKTGLNSKEISSLPTDENTKEELFRKLNEERVFEEMLKTREDILDELVVALETSGIIDGDEARKQMNKLLDLELFRIKYQL